VTFYILEKGQAQLQTRLQQNAGAEPQIKPKSFNLSKHCFLCFLPFFPCSKQPQLFVSNRL
jgi:Zn-finger protein